MGDPSLGEGFTVKGDPSFGQLYLGGRGGRYQEHGFKERCLSVGGAHRQSQAPRGFSGFWLF